MEEVKKKIFYHPIFSIKKYILTDTKISEYYPKIGNWPYSYVSLIKKSENFLKNNIFSVSMKSIKELIKFTLIHEKMMDEIIKKEYDIQRREDFNYNKKIIEEGIKEAEDYEPTDKEIEEYLNNYCNKGSRSIFEIKEDEHKN